MSDDVKLIYIKWFDSTYTTGQISFDDLPPLIEVETAGIFICEDEKQVILALDYFGKQNDGRHIAQIPKVNIIGRKFFTVNKGEKK